MYRKNIFTNKLFLLTVILVASITCLLNLIYTPLCGIVKADGDAVKTITVFSWEDYIEETDEDSGTTGVIADFEAENPNIKVDYYTFATCEEMYNELIKNPYACDILCPSEYMILKMKQEGLIIPYTMPQNFIDYGSPYIKEVFDDLGLTTETQTYAVGYMWGTMGLIYNAEKYTDADFKSWTDLYNEKFAGKITIKDSLRDSYIMALGIVYKDELLQLKSDFETTVINKDTYNQRLSEIFNRTDKDSVDKVCQALISLKNNLYGFEVDAGKNDLLTGKIDVNFAWSGDAVYSMFEADEFGKKLGFAVPEEGSNVWFDGWVMNKNADVESSLKFIDYLCRPDIAVRNMDYVGYTSCISGNSTDTTVFDYVLENFGAEDGVPSEDLDTTDLSYFFGEGDYVVQTEKDSTRFLFAQYANEQTILRCAVMDNFSVEDLELVNEMWNKVKLITLPTYVLIIIVVAIVLLIAGIVVFKYKEKIFEKNISTEQTKPRRKGYKVIKIEDVK
ncbi:MAG: extracellular solute-binding protein [Clostridiales bacterium]|nr:extracellular solute-binding protein [Clostridiales bacterium]